LRDFEKIPNEGTASAGKQRRLQILVKFFLNCCRYEAGKQKIPVRCLMYREGIFCFTAEVDAVIL
jgi:hypothetical protein